MKIEVGVGECWKYYVVDVEGNNVPCHSFDDETFEAEVILCNAEGRLIYRENPQTKQKETIRVPIKLYGAKFVRIEGDSE